MRTPLRMLALFPLVVLLLTACGESSEAVGPVDSAASAPSLASIQPGNATANVDPSTPIVLRFSHAMMTGMEMLVVLHEGNVTGAVVAATTTWSADRTILTLMPQAMAHHDVRGASVASLKDTAGVINLSAGTMMGGQNVSGGMMGSASMMNGQWGPGMMGAGWQAANGTFGMSFSFTTS